MPSTAVHRCCPSTLITGTSIFLLLIIGACAGTAASGTRTRAARSSVPDFSGSWEGQLVLIDDTGEVQLEMENENGVYSGQVALSLQGYNDLSSLSQIAAEGDTLTFWLYFETFGVDVHVWIWLEEDLMRGQVETFIDGELENEGTVTLRKK